LHFALACVPVQGNRYASTLVNPAAVAALYELTNALLTAPPVEHDCPYPLSTTFWFVFVKHVQKLELLASPKSTAARAVDVEVAECEAVRDPVLLGLNGACEWVGLGLGALFLTQHSTELSPGQSPATKTPPEQSLVVFLQIPAPLDVEQLLCTQHS